MSHCIGTQLPLCDSGSYKTFYIENLMIPFCRSVFKFLILFSSPFRFWVRALFASSWTVSSLKRNLNGWMISCRAQTKRRLKNRTQKRYATEFCTIDHEVSHRKLDSLGNIDSFDSMLKDLCSWLLLSFILEFYW